MSRDERVTVTTIVAVDPATAFKIFTDEVDHWWRRGPRYRFAESKNSKLQIEPETNGRVLETWEDQGGGSIELGRITGWEPGRRLAFTWSPPGLSPMFATSVEVRFEKAASLTGPGTRVTVEHAGWEALPAAHSARHGLTGEAFVSMIGLWWGDLLVGLQRRSADKRKEGSGAQAS